MRFEIYKDRSGEWRWSLKAANNKRIGNSGEGYKNLGDLVSILEEIKHQLVLNRVQTINMEGPYYQPSKFGMDE